MRGTPQDIDQTFQGKGVVDRHQGQFQLGSNSKRPGPSRTDGALVQKGT